jgi:hypothetical protein
MCGIFLENSHSLYVMNATYFILFFNFYDLQWLSLIACCLFSDDFKFQILFSEVALLQKHYELLMQGFTCHIWTKKFQI